MSKFTISEKLTIGVASHGNIKTTEICVNKILDSIEGNFELILVEDFSHERDEIINFYQSIKKRVPNTKIFNFDRNLTYTNSVNCILSHATGKKVLFVSNDVFINPYYIEEVLKISNLSKKIGVREVILVTAHRRENHGAGFERICMALQEIAKDDKERLIIFPVHLNPNVLEPVHSILSNLKNMHLIEPLDYLPFIKLMESSYFLLTDSGGIQEEAPSLGKPVLVMRDITERTEAVEAGTVKIVGTKKDEIIRNVQELLDNSNLYKSMSEANNPYGDGFSSSKIKKILLEVNK